MRTLKTSEILQINATVVAGLLILLTISSTQEQNPIWQLGKGFALLGWGSLLPFAASSIFALKDELRRTGDDLEIERTVHENNLRTSISLMLVGFLVLILYLGSYSFRLAVF